MLDILVATRTFPMFLTLAYIYYNTFELPDANVTKLVLAGTYAFEEVSL